MTSTPPPTRTAGSCLCGGCTYELLGQPIISALCHCDSCKRTSGSDSLWSLLFDKDRIDIKPTSQLLSYYDYSAPGVTTRQFCGTCGCPMFRIMQGMSVIFVAGGTVLNGQGTEKGKGPLHDWRPTLELFCKNKVEWLPDLVGKQGQYPGMMPLK